MRTISVIISALAIVNGPLIAQESNRPVPKDSVRETIAGCTKGYVFTAGPRTPAEPANLDIPDGMHLRMNGSKKMMADIKAHEGSMIEITGLMRKSQYNDGVGIGGGVRIIPAPRPTPSGVAADPTAGQIQIDVEGWRPIVGTCRPR
jgi:hypothetical protein